MNFIDQLIAACEARQAAREHLDQELEGWSLYEAHIEYGHLSATLLRPRDDLHNLTPDELLKIQTQLEADGVSVASMFDKVVVQVSWKLKDPKYQS
jgi:hypothetical protein